MTLHSLTGQINKATIWCCALITMRQLASLMLIVTLLAPTLMLAGTLQRARKSSYVGGWGDIPTNSQVNSGAQVSRGELAKVSRDYQEHDSAPLDIQTFASNGFFSANISGHITEPAVAESSPCNLYPIALSSNSLRGVAAGSFIGDIYNGAKPSNFGWLTWTGNSSEPTLAASLTPPGNSSTYINPKNSSDHEVSIGDWVPGKSGVSNSKDVRDALEALKARDIIVPVWNEARGQGINTLYRVEAFAQVRLLSYQLPGQNRISARFLGYTECPIPVNKAPQVNAGPDQTIKLPATASLNGTVTDDGLPRGGALTISWTKVSGPGSVTFSNTSRTTTTAAFSMAGTYVLRLTANDSQLSSSDEVTVSVSPANQPPIVNAGPDQTVSLPDNAGGSSEGFTLTRISTGFNSPIGIDYHQPSNKLVMSVNYDNGGEPNNFELVDANGAHTPFSNIHGLTDEIKIATARDEGNGMSRGGFHAGELFVGTGVPGVIARISADGSLIQNPWVALPGESGLFRGSLYVDRTGVFGGDLIAVTTTGGVWRINSAGQSMQLTRIGSAHLEGLSTIPNDTAKYGPWAGKILIGAEEQELFWAVDAAGNSTSYSLGIRPEDIDIIPEHENFFGIDYSGNTLWGAPAAAFANMTGDILVAQETPGFLWRIHWNGAAFEKTQLAQVAQWEHVTFAPAGVVEVPPVGTTVTLSGTATDDGLPSGNSLAVSWAKVSGPGPVTFSNSNQALTTATFTEPGTYVLRLSASDSELASSDEVTITVNPGNHAPSVNAGPDQAIMLPSTASLNGMVSDDGLPTGNTLTTLWSQVSGPGVVTFADASRASTTATFSVAGTYVLRLTASDSQLNGSDDVSISVNQIISPLEDATLLLEPALAGPNVIGATQTLKATLKDRNNIPVSGATIQFVVIGANPTNSNSTTSADGVASFTYTGAASGSDTVRASTTSGSLTIQSNFSSVHWVIPAQPISTTTVFGRFFTSDGSGFFSALPTQQPVFGQYFPGINFNPPANTVPGNTSGVGEFTRPFTNVTTDLNGNFTGTIVAQGNGFQAGQGALDSFNAVFTGSFTVSYAGDITFNFFSDDGFIFGVGNGATRVSGSYLNVPPSGLTPFESLTVVGAYNSPTSPVANSVTVHFPAPGIYPYEVDYSECCFGQLSLIMTTAASGNHGVPPSGSLTLSPNLISPLPVGQQQTFTVLAVDLSGAALVDVPLKLTIDGANAQHLDATTDGSGHASFSYTGMNSGLDALQVTAPIGSTTAYSNVVTVTWQGAVNNQAPVANAGPDLTITLPAEAVLNGSASDDGLPAGGALTASWSKVSGPGAVTFGNPNQTITPATFITPGTYVLRLSISDSELTGIDETTITVNPGNQSPTVNAGPDQAITVPNSASLNGTVADDGLPAGSTLTTTWSQVNGPGIVTFSNPNMAATTAAFSLPGTYSLRLTASDSQLSSSDEVTIVVNTEQSVNQRPIVNAGADQTIPQTGIASLNGTAADDGLPAGSTLSLTWSKVDGPGTVSFGNPQSAVTTATFGSAGRYVLRLTASDSQLSASDDVVVTVNAVNQAPTVDAGPDQTISLPDTANLRGTVTDDGFPVGSTLTITWSMVTGPGSIIFSSGNGGPATAIASFSDAGTYVLRLTANDGALTGSDEVTVTVNQGASPPVASIISPVDGSEITTRVNVVGSVSNGNWKLEYSLNTNEGSPAQSWVLFASGSGAVSNAGMGVFDPTLLLNGIYAIRLTATDAGGRTSSASTSVVVRGEQKIGNFTISFNDLSMAVAGLPIEVIRTYDSRDKRMGDFGVGWTLGLRNVRVEKTGILGQHWEITSTGGSLPTYCVQPTRPRLVTLTFPAGKVYKFQTVPNPQCQFAGANRFPTMGFAPLPGTQGSLVSLSDNEVFLSGGAVGPTELRLLDDQSLYNPTLFQLTTEDGTVFVIDQNLGVRNITDTNGNTLTVNNNGIIHSSGKSISFTRDAQGRITRITDPAGRSMSYSYDASGDLVSFSDRESNVSRYTYNTAHGLLTILDPRGIQPLRNDYDADGRLIKQTDAFGNVITFTHDLNAQREITRDRLNNVTIYEYDASGNVLKVTDAKGDVTTHTYDARDNLLTETNALGKTTTYTYDAQDNRLTETDALGNTTRYTYNSRKQALTITDPAGGVTTNTYDANGNLLSTRDPLGNTTTYVYSANGLPTSTKDALGNITTLEYDASGNLLKQIDPLSNATTYTYDANGNRLTSSVVRTNPAGALETLMTAYQYDRLNRLVKVIYPDASTTETIYNNIGQQGVTIDQLGRRTTYDYDEMGRLIRTTYPNDKKDESEYDAEGRRTKSIDRAGRSTTYTYDSLARLIKTTYSDGSFTTTDYDSIGRIIKVTDERGNATQYEYDPNCGCSGRRAKIIDALGKITSFTYDANGNQSSVTDAKGRKTSYEYDAVNRRTRTLYPDSTLASTAYNALGQVVSRTDQAGKTTQFEYDSRGNLVKVTDALGGVTRYAYDEVGNQLTQTDANNHTTIYEYDSMGRRTRRKLPLGMSELYAYDAAGNLTSRTDFLGKTTTFVYNVMNRLSRKMPDASLGQSPVIFSYTSTDRRLSMTDSTGSTTYFYDARDRLTSKAAPQGTLTYSYDAGSNLLSIRSSNANGVSVNYAYDALNRLSTVNDQRLASGTTSYTYDANGNLESTAYPNGVNTSYTYNALNRLTNLSATKGTTLARYAYTLGAAGNRLSVDELSGRTVSYTYDSLYRLTGETISNDAATNGTLNYNYDAVGNRLSRNSTVPGVSSTTSTYDANDRLTTDAYDPNGNTTNSGGNAYQYDFENRLASLNGGAVTYTYDGDGNRVSKTVGGVKTQFLVDTNNLTGHAQVVEEIIGGNVQRTYTYGQDLISQNQLIGGNWTPSFYGYDGHGSVRYLTNTNGTITDTYTYDAFGNLIARTGSTPNDYLYAGEQFDANFGFYYLRARYMNADSGRFWTQDTHEGAKEDPVSLHKYLYANADPVNNFDPSGHLTLSEISVTDTLRNLISTIRLTFTYERAKATVKTSVAAVAAAYLTYSLIFDRTQTNEGFIAKANLSSLPGNDWPDIEVEGRVSGDPQRLIALILRTSYKGIRGRLVITQSGISGNGGLNYNLFKNDVAGLATFKVDLALRAGRNITGPDMSQLAAVFEFKLDFINSFASVTARTSAITFGNEHNDITSF